jgi:hypothetical protein
MDDDSKGQKTQNFPGKFFKETTREKKFVAQIFILPRQAGLIHQIIRQLEQCHRDQNL